MPRQDRIDEEVVVMDERKIADLFADAVPEAPPASFTESDVRTTSHRQRRQSRVIAGSTLGVVLLAGGITAGVLLSGGGATPGNTVAAAQAETSSNAAASPRDAHIPGQQGAEPAPSVPESSAPSGRIFPTRPPVQGGATSGSAGPNAGSTHGGCAAADRELATALAGELPAAAGKQAVPSPMTCPESVRGAAFALRDGNSPPGVVSILLVPKGAALSGPVPWANSPKGTVVRTAYGPKGGEIVLVSQPPGGSTTAPFGKQLGTVAHDIAAKY